DYLGLGTAGPHPYLIGVPSAHAALDAVRAARQLPAARLGDRTVAWGHSQGGGAALWTGALAEAYAPDVPLSGVVAMAPASNPRALVENLPRVTGGSIFGAYTVAGYTALYPEVTFREYVRPGAEVTVRRLADRCLSGTDALASVLVVLGLSRDPEIFATPPTEGRFGLRLQENVPPPTVAAPLLIAQGGSDAIVPRAAQDEFVDQLCEAGQRLDYRSYAGRDHMPLVEPDSPLVPQLLEWTRARFAGVPVAAGCTRGEH
ncbi:MAG: lipase family protein, partial [Propionicimonas sp.]|nr:alpha/beta fold hydrolase [Propionicimonas sp.]